MSWDDITHAVLAVAIAANACFTWLTFRREGR